MGCLVILGSLIGSELPTINIANSHPVGLHSTTPDSSTPKAYTESIVDIDFDTDPHSRVYFINKQPVKVNTSQQGWVVDLMYAQKKKDKKVKTLQKQKTIN